MSNILTPQLESRLQYRKYTYKFTSYSGLRPGDLVQFSYMGVLRHGFVISSRRTSSGIFMSTKNNSLYNVIDANQLEDSTFQYLLNTIYNDDTKADYHSLKLEIGSLNKNTGVTSINEFRTVHIMGIRSILKIEIQNQDNE